MKINFDNRVILKPWGEEYNIFRNKKKIAITYLRIKKGLSTSLHCHPSKKTGFFHLGNLIEVNDTETIFSTPANDKTLDYVTGRFG